MKHPGDTASPEAAEFGASRSVATTSSLVDGSGKRCQVSTIRMLLPIWGHRYITQCLEFLVPTIMAPGNIPALASALPTHFEFLTSAQDEAFIRRHPAFQQLSQVCTTTIHTIDHLITARNYSTTITLAYAEAVRAAGSAMLETCFFFLVSDYIVADGSFATVLARIQAGANAVLVGNFQVAEEEALPSLRTRLSQTSTNLSLTPRELMRWALPRLHPATMSNIVNNPLSHNAHCNRLFWRLDPNTILGRFYLMHMIAIQPEVADFQIGSSCDYSFVPEMCPSGKISVVTNSDDYLVVEMQPKTHEASFRRYGTASPVEIAKSLSEWTTARHRENARQSIVFHADGLPQSLPDAIAIADEYVAKIERSLKQVPQPHRGHPYWAGAIAAFHEATGQKLSPQERQWLFNPQTKYFSAVECLRDALCGQKPYVYPWHPRWPDYRLVLQQLGSFFSDNSRRLLAVSNLPTAINVMLADYGDRVSRVEADVLLRRSPSGSTPSMQFDVALVQLSELEVRKAGSIVERITPLLKPGGKIVFVIESAQPINENLEKIFRHQVSPAGFSQAWVTDMQFVAENQFRQSIHQLFINLGSEAHRNPWLGIPTLAILSLPLALITLISNLSAIMSQRGSVTGRIASTLVLVAQMDMPEDCSSLEPYDSSGNMPMLQPDTALLPPAPKQTREPQYNNCVELLESRGLARLGLMTNQVWHDDPRRLLFVLSRYKFVAKMLNGAERVLEIGCADAFGTRIVQQEVESVLAIDFDEVFINDVRDRMDPDWQFDCKLHDILECPVTGNFDGAYTLDVIEHISPEDEERFVGNITASLTTHGVLIVGTPSLQSQAYASATSREGHINCKTKEELEQLLKRFFHNVVIFSMNDEVVHTGFYPMAHYLFAVCSAKR